MKNLVVPNQSGAPITRVPDTISLDFPDEAIRAVVKNVGDVFKLNLDIPEALQGRTSIKLRDVTWRQIFTSVLDPVGYGFVEVGTVVKILPKVASAVPGPAAPVPTPVARPRDTITIDFPNEDVRSILRNVADLFELNLIIPESLQGKASVKLANVTWRQIYQTVLEPVNHTFVEEGNIIKIVPKAAAAPPPSSSVQGGAVPEYSYNGTSGSFEVRGYVGVFDPKNLDESPKPISQPAPVYPAGLGGSVRVSFIVDRNGVTQNVLIVTSTSRELEPAALLAVTKWKYQPGKKAGQTVATFMFFDFVVTTDQKTSATTQPAAVFAVAAVPPADRDSDLILRADPIYPPAMRQAGTEGKVTVGYIVDAKGAVQSARLISSSARAFESSALDAVRQWKFTPARKAGNAVATNEQVSIAFILVPEGQPASEGLLSGDGVHGRTLVVADTKYTKPPMPVPGQVFALRDLDTPPSATLQMGPVFPAELRLPGMEGHVTVAFIVDENGLVQNVHAVAPSDAGFADAAMAAVSKWQFKPGRKAGRAVATEMSVPINFHLAGNR